MPFRGGIEVSIYLDIYTSSRLSEQLAKSLMKACLFTCCLNSNILFMKATVLKFIFSLAVLLTLHTACETKKSTETTNEEANDNSEVNTKQETPTKMIESLVGEWQVDRILNGEQNVTNDQGGANQTLTFTNEARYIRRSGNQKVDSGAYRMNEQLNNLYLESETNEQAEEWEVDFESGTMTLTRTADGNTNRNLQYIYRRTSASQGQNQ